MLSSSNKYQTMNNFPKKPVRWIRNGKIMNFDRNKLFKGHSGELYHSSGNSLCLRNCYFAGTVVNEYDPSENITTTHVYCSKQNNKNIENIMNTFLKHHLIGALFFEDGPYTIMFTKYNCEFTAKYENKGIAFTNHFDNIEEIRQCNRFMSLFKKTILSTSIDSIMSSKRLLENDVLSLDYNFLSKYSGIS